MNSVDSKPTQSPQTPSSKVFPDLEFTENGAAPALPGTGSESSVQCNVTEERSGGILPKLFPWLGQRVINEKNAAALNHVRKSLAESIARDESLQAAVDSSEARIDGLHALAIEITRLNEINIARADGMEAQLFEKISDIAVAVRDTHLQMGEIRRQLTENQAEAVRRDLQIREQFKRLEASGLQTTPEVRNLLNYPFGPASGREQARLLFDLSIAVSAFDESQPNKKVLDFACGTGWTSEWLNRLGYDVYAFDVDPAAIQMANLRPAIDPRIDPARFHTSIADGHTIGFPDESFGHVFCFDSLHHMKNYHDVLREMHRVLIPGGRAVFIEPGSRHSSSPETLQFLKDHAFGDWWIERDVDLMELNELGVAVGFAGLFVKPFMLPSMVNFTFTDWYHILDNPPGISNYMNELRRFAYEDRIAFYFVKASV